MSAVVIAGDTSGTITIQAPAAAGSNTLNLQAASGTLAPIVSGTAVASTSGTAIDFTGIPSWAKRVTVMFNGVSTSGASLPLIQCGTSGGVVSTGYASTGSSTNGSTIGSSNSTAGFIIRDGGNATDTRSGHYVLTSLGSNVWIGSYSMKSNTTSCGFGGGDVTLSGTLDRIRVTTVNGTDTFDAGSINIMWE